MDKIDKKIVIEELKNYGIRHEVIKAISKRWCDVDKINNEFHKYIMNNDNIWNESGKIVLKYIELKRKYVEEVMRKFANDNDDVLIKVNYLWEEYEMGVTKNNKFILLNNDKELKNIRFADEYEKKRIIKDFDYKYQ